ncbi:response regulator transcription factor [Pseudomonas poae]|uniref:DNA-binding response regulator, OmpR family, contains REC and winged-helix (WHTH) domain n=1 Tax=Pseudomonas poae TaxID=200451 RepID=A0ABY0RBN6_9PSED|nr:response regulator transcription factor [Pseudomonas poae]KRP45634.1 chemotaxis protein CheY [Pseudomonas poae]SDN53954.1 DNA-binding response regulator, OmpR family, contains REC and winged-helix (wHTH) domain [Pseudomonas poae]
MISVLLVDDDEDLTAMLRQYLAREGFDATAVHTGEEGEEQALSGRYSIVVLDVMLPQLSGIEVLRRIRAVSQVPIVLLTARGDNIDRIAGLELGADDYVPKPSSPGELVARLRAIMRRVQPAESPTVDVIRSGELVLWPARREARWQGAELGVTSTEFSLLEELARCAGQVVSKTDLSLNALGCPLKRYDRRIDVHISSIRQKLRRRSDGKAWIQSVRGLGYQLIVE